MEEATRAEERLVAMDAARAALVMMAILTLTVNMEAQDLAKARMAARAVEMATTRAQTTAQVAAGDHQTVA